MRLYSTSTKRQNNQISSVFLIVVNSSFTEHYLQRSFRHNLENSSVAVSMSTGPLEDDLLEGKGD